MPESEPVKRKLIWQKFLDEVEESLARLKIEGDIRRAQDAGMFLPESSKIQ